MRPEVVQVGRCGYLACVLLLAPELLVIALCSGTAESELNPVDIMDGANVAKLSSAARASALARAAALCGACAVYALACRGFALHMRRTSQTVGASRVWC